MNPLLEQFLSESRDGLQEIGALLMALERTPSDEEAMTSLFRLVHTLKGNSGLFELQEMTRVLHAAEDLMDAVRHGKVTFSKALADSLLDAMDFVGLLCDEIETRGEVGAEHATASARLAESMRALVPTGTAASRHAFGTDALATDVAQAALRQACRDMPEAVRALARQHLAQDGTLHLVEYAPAEECFFQGDDPFHLVRSAPGALWGAIAAREAWPAIAEMDAYRCMLDFRMLTDAPLAELHEHFRYVPDQVRGGVVTAAAVSECAVEESARAVDNAAAGAVAPRRASSAPEIESAIDAVLASQRELLSLPADVAWHAGRTASAIETLAACARAAGTASLLDALHAAAARSHGPQGAEPLLAWIDAFATVPAPAPAPVMEVAADVMTCRDAASPGDGDARSARRPEEGPAAPRSLKVDQVKIDRLMDLIGEMIVSKNALPYLADRAEDVYGSRELAREIKAQYATINRIAEEMQDAIMQVRMMPVSFVFQRFPRLVRDTSRRLGKDVQLVLDGEDAEADKNIIEALSDPLVHIVRNSLDHGFELPEARRAAGKPVTGTLTIRARQEGDRVIIEIRDDGKGIDPEVVKRKAYASGLIDEQTLERMSDAEAINLIFAPGFSTMDVVSDLSGRGVGMDVVRTAIERVNGSVSLHSERGRGTRLRLSLPLSMAVTHVMIVETNARLFGLPMDCVVETVRVPRSAVHGIKQSEATVLRGQVVPLRSLNRLLQVPVAQRTNGDDELAVLVVRTSDGTMGLVVDDFQSTADVILKPLAGMLAGLPMYTGSALMGDGSVLMVLNAKELL